MKIYIVAAQRTPIGSFQGALSQTPAPRLGAHVVQALLKQTGIDANHVDECIFGQVLMAGSGQAPARQAAIFGGLPTSTACTTVHKVCGSGLKSVMLASDSIALGHTQIAIAGGQENMSLAPHLLERSREGYRMGSVQVADSMIKDGLWDPYNNYHMGNAAELCVREYKLSREEQDAFARQSYEKAQKAQAAKAFAKEIAPIEVTIGRDKRLFTEDEEPAKARFDKFAQLKPAFEPTGTITAANSSKINDGAAAVLLASEDAVKAHGLKPLARVVAHATHAQEPQWFTTAPIGAIQKVLKRAQLTTSDIDVYEINEAFSAVALATTRELKLRLESVNVHGGAVALGHPIGASGARLLTTAVHALHTRQVQRALVTLCLGGGEAVALVAERV